MAAPGCGVQGELFFPAAIFQMPIETGRLASVHWQPRCQQPTAVLALAGEHRLGRVPAENAALSFAPPDPPSISFVPAIGFRPPCAQFPASERSGTVRWKSYFSSAIWTARRPHQGDRSVCASQKRNLSSVYPDSRRQGFPANSADIRTTRKILGNKSLRGPFAKPAPTHVSQLAPAHSVKCSHTAKDFLE